MGKHGVIGFDFACYWLKNWREILKPVTKRNNRNRVIIFSIHLKTALSATFNLASMLAQSHSRGLWAKGGRKALETKLVNGILLFRDGAIFFAQSDALRRSNTPPPPSPDLYIFFTSGI